jgi:uncharacterized protein with PIN domain
MPESQKIDFEKQVGTKATTEFLLGMKSGSIKLRIEWPLIQPSIQVQQNTRCAVCVGRGLLKFPDGWVENNAKEKVFFLDGHVLVCPECKGHGVPWHDLDRCLKAQYVNHEAVSA